RPGKEEEPVVGKGRQVELKGGRRTAVSRLQADPPQLITRRGHLVREDLEPVQGPHRVAASQFFRSHHPRPPGEPSAILADVRNCPGVTPTRRLKWRVNWLWSEKPARRASSARERSVPACRSCLARSTRRRMTYW